MSTAIEDVPVFARSKRLQAENAPVEVLDRRQIVRIKNRFQD
jgi:hypothetical protein